MCANTSLSLRSTSTTIGLCMASAVAKSASRARLETSSRSRRLRSAPSMAAFSAARAVAAVCRNGRYRAFTSWRAIPYRTAMAITKRVSATPAPAAPAGIAASPSCVFSTSPPTNPAPTINTSGMTRIGPRNTPEIRHARSCVNEPASAFMHASMLPGPPTGTVGSASARCRYPRTVWCAASVISVRRPFHPPSSVMRAACALRISGIAASNTLSAIQTRSS